MRNDYIALMRLNKPIGIALLLWPTLWGLWLADDNHVDPFIVMIFIMGVVIMRSAGCIINDIADRNFDGFVKRTKDRPLAKKNISLFAALFLFLTLLSLAFSLVLFCNTLTIKLAFVGAALTIIYPFLKRVTHLPQVGLGAAFAWSVPMAFAAVTNEIPVKAWWLYICALLWPIIYDTMYAMADKEDDVKIGIKSTAILFGEWDVLIISSLQLLFIACMFVTGFLFDLGVFYYLSIAGVGLLFLYQFNLIQTSLPENCIAAFLNNNWVGLLIFIGIMLSPLL